MAAYHTYRATGCVLRDGKYPIKPSADEFISVELPADYQMGATVGAAQRPIERVSDRSATATVNCGNKTPGHAAIMGAYIEQQVIEGTGLNPSGVHIFRLSNGEVITGSGVISRPTTRDGGVDTGAAAWTVMLAEARWVPNPAQLLAELGIAGAI
jgi:hypothetical protein